MNVFYAASQNDFTVMVDLAEGATLSLAINHTIMEEGIYPSVTFKQGMDTEDNGNASKSPLMGWKARINVYPAHSFH